MDTILQRTVRNSDLIIDKSKRVFLTYPAVGLATCALDEREDSVVFNFDTNDMEPAESVLKKPMWEQLRFLMNCADLSSLSEEYSFSLSPDNIVVDVNLMPRLLVRDAKVDNVNFLQNYVALIGSVLQTKYKYHQYLNGGQANYKKNKLLNELAVMESTESIREHLLCEYRRLVEEVNQTRKLVKKKNVWVNRITIPMLAVTLAVSLFFGGRFFFVDIPFRDSLIAANAAYIVFDYIGVQQALRPYDVSQLNENTRRVLSRAYVATEALTVAQRDNILVGLAQLTDPIIFDFWIMLGRLHFNEAIDIAQRLGDDEMLLFAYLKQEAFVRQDMTRPGEERTALLSYLVGQIERLNRERGEAAASINEAGGANP